MFCWGASEALGPGAAAAGSCGADGGAPVDAGVDTDAATAADAGADLDGGTAAGTACAVTRPALVSGVRQPLSIAAGGAMSCAVGPDHAASCWGTWSALDGAGACAPAVHDPTRLPGLPLVTSISLGGGFGCAVALDGSTLCFGADDAAQLGRGAASVTACATPGPVATAARFSWLALGARHACGLEESGRVWCWGDNAYGALGTGTALASSGTPTAVTLSPDISDLAAGDGFGCALSRLTGSVSCWGRNDAGQLGLGVSDAVAHPTPAPVSAPASFLTIAAGGAHVCAIDSAGAAWCWGLATEGQLGTTSATELCAAVDATGPRACATRPVAVDGGHRFVSLSLGAAHSCAVRSDDAVVCWGRGTEGQLGTATTASSARAQSVDR